MMVPTPAAPDFLVRVARRPLFQFRAVPYNSDRCLANAITGNFNRHIRFIGREHVISKLAGKPFAPDQYAVHAMDCALRITTAVHLRREIVMVEDETFP